MHGILNRGLQSGAVSKLMRKSVEPRSEQDPNKVYNPDGSWSYKDDVNKLYEGNPYYSGSVSEETGATVKLDKSVQAENHISNNPEYEKAFSDGIGNPDYYRKKETLDDIYRGNPYYRPSQA